MTTPKIVSQAEMYSLVGNSFDAETRAKLLHGETTLKCARGEFACERRPRATTTTNAAPAPASSPASGATPFKCGNGRIVVELF